MYVVDAVWRALWEGQMAETGRSSEAIGELWWVVFGLSLDFGCESVVGMVSADFGGPFGMLGFGNAETVAPCDLYFAARD